ncbi:hypothetical protein CO168_01970 [Candidatus Shapirobacteria bacterium CG_4_9_14_3_um_filter_36_12]|uniref:Uncharacterized protein n=3 Tax=Candidatus Shapironibacteriota TaxID=1752721 RepID=A0A2M7XN80_9BACT|nr:MAG: hypothetical protein COZ41_02950 [Candidatus Shapirobacteria bacterium CG_4_10_14_3_um_filter_35_13]PJA51038.1 MAG: hypothetical protein CO168_01970 [Candidatus Shapirobacteria bacterium CG_4_9_14_3_um_filter_36_12]PJE67177.1 MAG: hypothetical protein COU93_00185 [Candidatus Shapirobacteria bacterium CG10_big_fil_rev_8_21_14_0_10_36_6]
MTNIISALSAKLVPAVYAQSGKIVLTPGTADFDPLTRMTVGGIVSGAISLAMLAVALIFFFILIAGGLRWVMSEGDQKAVEAARGQITNALIGLAIVFAAFAIMKLIEIVFGISLLNGITIPTFNK